MATSGIQIPVVFRSGGGNVISSYDWYDTGLGAGYKRFYPASYINGASTQVYFMTSKLIDGDNGATGLAGNNNVTEVNFDITFQNPMVVAAGTAIINFTVYSAGAVNKTVDFTLYHVDASAVETSIGTVQSSNANGAGAYRKLVSITTTQKAFAIGEKLRLECIFTVGAGAATLYFDPLGRQTYTEAGTGGTIGTDMIVDIPFRIDL